MDKNETCIYEQLKNADNITKAIASVPLEKESTLIMLANAYLEGIRTGHQLASKDKGEIEI